jgi:hypothetical protein
VNIKGMSIVVEECDLARITRPRDKTHTLIMCSASCDTGFILLRYR